MTTPGQLPLRLPRRRKTDVRPQFAALPFRMAGERLEICLITARGSGRWIIPKGWPMNGQTPAQAAAMEAFEEAGLRGRAFDICLGVYSYRKKVAKAPRALIALVYPVEVEQVLEDWPERRQRKRLWLPRGEAADRLAELELREIVRNFNPDRLPP